MIKIYRSRLKKAIMVNDTPPPRRLVPLFIQARPGGGGSGEKILLL